MDKHTVVHPQDGILFSLTRNEPQIHATTKMNLNLSLILKVKELSFKSEYTVWFHFYDMLPKTNYKDR